MFSSFFGKNIHTRVYLDNAGATEVEKESAQAFVETLGMYGNPSGIHKEGAQASQILDRARVNCANVLNAHSYEIYFAGSGTESCNLAILGTYTAFARTHKTIISDLHPHVITSVIEHPSVLEPIRNLEREGKISVTYLPVYEEGIIRVKDLIEALTSETILVSIMYANNEVGTIQPVKEIGRAIENWKREKNIAYTAYPYFHTDACQAANYCNLDVLRIKAHLMTVNSSKVYGPKGSALLYKREGVRLDPIVYGGGQERMLRSGTENIASIYAFSVALTNAHQMQDTESARLRALRDETVSSLKKQIPDIIFYGAFDEYQTTHLGEEKKEKVHYVLSYVSQITLTVAYQESQAKK